MSCIEVSADICTLECYVQHPCLLHNGSTGLQEIRWQHQASCTLERYACAHAQPTWHDVLQSCDAPKRFQPVTVSHASCSPCTDFTLI